MTTVTPLRTPQGCALSAEPLQDLEYLSIPERDGAYYLAMPHGTVLLSVDLRLSVIAVWADQAPNARDWTELCMILKDLHASPLGEPEFADELDMWLVHADIAHCEYPIVAAMARAYQAA